MGPVARITKKKRLTVAVAESSDATRRFYTGPFAELGHDVTVHDEPAKAGDALAQSGADAVLIELAPPDEALKTLRHVRRALPDVVLGAVIASFSDDLAEKALGAGADLLLLKPNPVGRGPRSLAHQIRQCLQLRQAVAESARASAELARAREDLATMGLVDPATEALNDRYLDRRLKEEVSRGRRYGRPLSLLIIDVDDFRAYADRQGDAMGTLLLRQLAALLRFGTRLSDAVCRREADEFAVILPETALTNAVTVAEKLRRAVADFSFTGGEEQPLGQVTISIGCAGLDETTSESGSLVEAALGALSEAKARGKDTVCW